MNKVATITSKVFLTLLVLSPAPIYFLLIYNDLTNDPNSHEPWVSFFDNPNESVYVSWETEEKSSGKVLYGTSRENLSNETDSELLETNIHHVHVEGLQANTTYYFQAVWDESNSRIGTFTTAPNNASSYKFVMISDTQQPKVGPGHHNKIAELIKGKDYRFINIVGDWVDDADYKFLWNNFFTVASVYTDEIPFAPVVGNHDRINHDGTY